MDTECSCPETVHYPAVVGTGSDKVFCLSFTSMVRVVLSRDARSGWFLQGLLGHGPEVHCYHFFFYKSTLPFVVKEKKILPTWGLKLER